MKPTRSIPWVLLTALAGCGNFQAQPTQPSVAPDMATVHQPPPANGSGSTSDCGGVPEKGRCELVGSEEMAETCDLAADQVHKIDCTAIGKHCLLDAHKGATCGALPAPTGPTTPPSDGSAPPVTSDGGTMNPPPPPPPGTPPKGPTPPPPPPPPPPPHDLGTTPTPTPDMSMPDLCTHGVTADGYCSGSTAIWCDPATGEIVTWNCAQDGYSCQEFSCASGAYCCGDPSAPMQDMSMPSTPSPECTSLGYDGECQGNVATWCDNGTIYTIDCDTRGQTCAVNSCATGAYCCDTPTTPPVDAPDLSPAPDPTLSQCDQLGLKGECGGLSGNVATWCAAGQIMEDDCTTKGQTCQVDTCGYGANCCP
jgi:hypothetical protein